MEEENENNADAVEEDGEEGSGNGNGGADGGVKRQSGRQSVTARGETRASGWAWCVCVRVCVCAVWCGTVWWVWCVDAGRWAASRRLAGIPYLPTVLPACLCTAYQRIYGKL